MAQREGYHESIRCSRDNYPESCITKYTSIRRNSSFHEVNQLWNCVESTAAILGSGSSSGELQSLEAATESTVPGRSWTLQGERLPRSAPSDEVSHARLAQLQLRALFPHNLQSAQHFRLEMAQAKASTVLRVPNPVWNFHREGLPTQPATLVKKDPFDSRRERSPQTVTSKVSTGASKKMCQSRPRIVAFSKTSSSWQSSRVRRSLPAPAAPTLLHRNVICYIGHPQSWC